MKTIRSERIGKVELRLVKTNDGYVGALFGGTPMPHIHGDDPDQLWAKLRAEVGKASPAYFGLDGARTRFLHLFPEGFEGTTFADEERNYKTKVAQFLKANLPWTSALGATAEDANVALKAFGKANLLSPFEAARLGDLFKTKDGPAFVRAAAQIADGAISEGLKAMSELGKRHGKLSWPMATYLPFFWRPETHMFLKPEVTRDFAERIGHSFAQVYRPQLDAEVYRSVLDLAGAVRREMADLNPRDLIDVQSFIWIVGAYSEADALKLAKPT